VVIVQNSILTVPLFIFKYFS